MSDSASPATSRASRPRKRSPLALLLSPWVVLPVGLVVGAVIGWAIAQPTVAEKESQIVELQRDVTVAEAGRADAEAKMKDATAAMREKEKKLAEEEAAVAAREAAVAATEQKIKDSSFGGGLLVVGRDVTAGTYRTGELTTSCYYAWKTGTGADADIVDNNIVSSGTATVTLADGETFESSRCGTWTKIG